MKINFLCGIDFRFTLVVMWTLSTIFIFGYLTAGPARDEKGMIYKDWQARAVVGKVLVAALIILPTVRRTTIVDSEKRILKICDQILFAVPLRTIEIPFSKVTGITFRIAKHEDYKKIAILLLHIENQKRRIMFRHDSRNFDQDRQTAEELAKTMGVGLTLLRV